MLMLKIQRFRERVHQWGLMRAIHWQMMRALELLLGLRVHYVFVGSGSGRLERVEAPEIPAGYRVRMAALADLLPYSGTVQELRAAFLEEAFAGGDVCVASFHGNELVGFSFQSGGRSPVTAQLDILVPEGFRYTYKTWIHPDHRRRNLSQIQNYVRHHARPGKDRLRGFWYVETHNYPSLLHGYRRPEDRALIMGLIGWVSLFGRQIPFRSPRARWLGVELVRKGDHRARQYLQ